MKFSSAKEEYVVSTTTSSQAVLLHIVLDDIKQEQEGPTLVYCDNISTLSFVKEPCFSPKEKAY